MMSPYWRLMRLHQPVGIWLLLWPCWWSLALATPGMPSLWLAALFAAGAVLMRSAGCIVNDMADREFDRQVERTRNRPLASGELSVRQAAILLALLVFSSSTIAYALGIPVLLWAAFSLILAAAYPFMKRITWWPQFFLGLTFNWGALLGWVAVHGEPGWPALLLYIGGIFWTLGYDTIYAHQDKADDALIGVKSTALRFGDNSKLWIGAFYLLAIIFWTLAGGMAGENLWFFLVLPLTMLHFGWQIARVNLDKPESCRRIFISNIYLGWLLLAALLAGKI